VSRGEKPFRRTRLVGAIAPVVAAVLPLAKVAEAHQLVEGGGVVGKIVIDCR